MDPGTARGQGEGWGMDAAQLLLLAIGAVGVAAVARRLGWQAPLLLVVVGFGVSFLPGMPEAEIDGELLLAVVLPPLLYSSALGVSYVGFRALLHPIVQLGVVLVLVTAVAVALVARVSCPGCLRRSRWCSARSWPHRTPSPPPRSAASSGCRGG